MSENATIIPLSRVNRPTALLKSLDAEAAVQAAVPAAADSPRTGADDSGWVMSQIVEGLLLIAESLETEAPGKRVEDRAGD